MRSQWVFIMLKETKNPMTGGRRNNPPVRRRVCEARAPSFLPRLAPESGDRRIFPQERALGTWIRVYRAIDVSDYVVLAVGLE